MHAFLSVIVVRRLLRLKRNGNAKVDEVDLALYTHKSASLIHCRQKVVKTYVLLDITALNIALAVAAH